MTVLATRRLYVALAIGGVLIGGSQLVFEPFMAQALADSKADHEFAVLLQEGLQAARNGNCDLANDRVRRLAMLRPIGPDKAIDPNIANLILESQQCETFRNAEEELSRAKPKSSDSAKAQSTPHGTDQRTPLSLQSRTDQPLNDNTQCTNIKAKFDECDKMNDEDSEKKCGYMYDYFTNTMIDIDNVAAKNGGRRIFTDNNNKQDKESLSTAVAAALTFCQEREFAHTTIHKMSSIAYNAMLSTRK